MLCFCGFNDEDGGQSSSKMGQDALDTSLHILPAINADIAADFLLDAAKPRHKLCSQLIKDWGHCTHIFSLYGTVLLLTFTHEEVNMGQCHHTLRKLCAGCKRVSGIMLNIGIANKAFSVSASLLFLESTVVDVC